MLKRSCDDYFMLMRLIKLGSVCLLVCLLLNGTSALCGHVIIIIEDSFCFKRYFFVKHQLQNYSCFRIYISRENKAKT